MMKQRGAEENVTRHRFGNVLQYIDDNLERPLTINELAQLLKLSAFHFARLFKLATGKSPHRYIVERRIKRAQDLLTYSRSSIPEIAYRVGFSSQSHMTTVFRKQAGVTPKALRRSDIHDRYRDDLAG